MKRLMIAAALCLFATVAHAQTLPQPAAPNNTVVCLVVNSTLTASGSPIGQQQACYGVTDSVMEGLLAAYGQQCALQPGSVSCTPDQVLALLAASLQKQVLYTVQQYLITQAQAAAAAATTAPTVTPLQ